MDKKFKKIMKSFFMGVAFVANIALVNTVSAWHETAYVQEANNNSKLDFTFSIKLDINIFQFQGDDLGRSEKKINEDLMSYVNEMCGGYRNSFDGFIDDLSANCYILSGEHKLSVFYDVHYNDNDFLSIIVYAKPTGGGGNGCRTSLKAFNYILKGGANYVFNLSISDVIKDNKSQFELMEKINEKLAQRKYPLRAAGLDNLFKSAEFAFAKEEFIVNFQPYSVGSGADCVVEVRFKYSEVKDLLSPSILDVLKL